MCGTKFVIVMLCLVNFVQPRKLYYSNSDDPSAIVFDGPTNYDTRKPSENEVLDDDSISLLINPRFGEVEVSATKPPPPPQHVDTGFFFPDD